MNQEYFQDWLFHYNPYTKQWAAFRREHHTAYFSGEYNNPDIFRSSRIRNLQDIIVRGQGDPEKMRSLIQE